MCSYVTWRISGDCASKLHHKRVSVPSRRTFAASRLQGVVVALAATHLKASTDVSIMNLQDSVILHAYYGQLRFLVLGFHAGAGSGRATVPAIPLSSHDRLQWCSADKGCGPGTCKNQTTDAAGRVRMLPVRHYLKSGLLDHL